MIEQLAMIPWPILWLLGFGIGSLIGALVGPPIADWIVGRPADWFDPESRHYVGQRRR